MKALVTGATGFIGIPLCLKLAEQGYEVVAMYRSPEKTKPLYHPQIKLIQGDICNLESVEQSMKSCDVVFHLAAYAQMWSKERDTFYRINYLGTENIMKSAKKNHIKKIIITSTSGVLGPSYDTAVHENMERKAPFFNAYETTKAQAETMVKNYAQNGMDVVIVNPTRVFGPGLLSTSNGVTRMMLLYHKGRFRTLPGNGKSIGNYAYIDDVVRGFILAVEKGKRGERYILGGENMSYSDFFKVVSRVSGRNYIMFKMYLPLMLALSWIFLIQAKLFNTAPFMTPEWARKFSYNWELSSEKAQKELGYSIEPFEECVRKTFDYLKEQKQL